MNLLFQKISKVNKIKYLVRYALGQCALFLRASICIKIVNYLCFCRLFSEIKFTKQILYHLLITMWNFHFVLNYSSVKRTVHLNEISNSFSPCRHTLDDAPYITHMQSHARISCQMIITLLAYNIFFGSVFFCVGISVRRCIAHC